MPSRVFTGILLAGHKEDAVEVPFDPAGEWSIRPGPVAPGRRGFAVQAKLNDIDFASFVVARSKRHWLLVDPSVKLLAKVSTGDTLTISLAPTDDARLLEGSCHCVSRVRTLIRRLPRFPA